MYAYNGWFELGVENIYKTIKLNSFGLDNNTVPHKFTIEYLNINYRSIPEICNIFSNYAYSGMIDPNRKSEQRQKLQINNYNLKPIEIITYNIVGNIPAQRPLQCRRSQYNAYATAFTIELINQLANSVKTQWEPKSIEQNIDTNIYMSNSLLNSVAYTIGIITPYRIQSQIISNILSSLEWAGRTVKFVPGTVHGFQGDECDIILLLLPSSLKPGLGSYTNKKELLNVAVSRAKDYLIIITSDSLQNSNDVHNYKSLMNLINNNREFVNTNTSKYWLNDVLNIKDLDENITVLEHKEVNLFKKSEVKYEFRYDQNFVDIQVNSDN